MKLMRCEDCPSELDEALYARLHDWRAERAKGLGQPAYCIFTDKTLLAIAETVPENEGQLAAISGVGVRKLGRFGADVLALCAGQDLADADGAAGTAEGASDERVADVSKKSSEDSSKK